MMVRKYRYMAVKVKIRLSSHKTINTFMYTFETTKKFTAKKLLPGDMLANIVIGIVWKGSPHPIPIPCQKPKFDQLFCLSVLSEFKGSTSNEERPLRFTFATICSILCVQMDQL